jgi:hypothetical protein
MAVSTTSTSYADSNLFLLLLYFTQWDDKCKKKHIHSSNNILGIFLCDTALSWNAESPA